MDRQYAIYAAEQAKTLLAIDSPTGYTARAAEWVKDAFAVMGYAARITTKGGVLIDLGGEDTNDALLLQAHTDTLGARVAEVKGNGRLRVTALGGMRAENGELRLPHTCVNIRITKPVEIYPELSPVVGQIYPAERYSPPTSTKRYGYVIKSGGKRINIRADECVEV